MDRTVIDTKRENKELCESIYKRLERLTIVHECSEDLRSVLTKDMFIKSNPKAFLHVMHFLFTIYDPGEFKKRFYWPVSDKTTESSFRSSTIEYLQYLNEKHQLGWTQIKSFLVVMPGGSKFMTLLSSLIDFIIQDSIKKLETELDSELDRYKSQKQDFSTLMRKINDKNKKIKESVLKLRIAIDAGRKFFTEKSAKLKKPLNEIAKFCQLDYSFVNSERFLEKLEANNIQFSEEKIVKAINNIIGLETKIEELYVKTEELCNENNEFPCDRDQLSQSFNVIQQENPNTITEELVKDHQIDMEALLQAFGYAVMNFQTIMSETALKSEESLQFEDEQITKVLNELKQIEAKVDELEENFKSAENNHQQALVLRTPPQTLLANDLEKIRSKIVNTPPLMFEVGGPLGQFARPRLALIDEGQTLCNAKSLSLFNQSAAIRAPSTAKKSATKRYNESFKSDTDKKSKILDPITLLRSITKQKKPENYNRSNLNASSLSYNDRMAMMGNETINSPENEETVKAIQPQDNEISQQNTITAEGNDFSEIVRYERTYSTYNETPLASRSGSSKNCRAVIRKQFFETSTTVASPDSIIYEQRTRTNSIIKNLTATNTHHQFNLTHLNKSPTGRLDALVKITENDVPKLKLNNETIQETPLTETIDENNKNDINISKLSSDDVLGKELATTSDESHEDWSLFNESDTILNDLPF